MNEYMVRFRLKRGDAIVQVLVVEQCFSRFFEAPGLSLKKAFNGPLFQVFLAGFLNDVGEVGIICNPMTFLVMPHDLRNFHINRSNSVRK
jgi:hypothetical protein